MTTRSEHLSWAKKRALEYVDAGRTDDAFASFVADIEKHEETAPLMDFVRMVGFPQFIAGDLDNPAKMRKFIEGFA